MSREVQDLMFKTPKIMKKVLIPIDLVTKPKNFDKFYVERGKYLKNLCITFTLDDPDLLTSFLNRVPNLEQLYCRSGIVRKMNKNFEEFSEIPFHLPQLKHLVLKGDLIYLNLLYLF